MKILERQFENKRYLLIRRNKYIIVKDKEKNKFYEIPAEKFDDENITWVIKRKNHSSFVLIGYIFVLILFSVYNCVEYQAFFVADKNLSVSSFTQILIMYMFFFIPVHELGHLLMLKHYGGTSEKVGFKFNYIFPSFYVRLNDTYTFDKIEKFYVHSAGIFNSVILNAALYVLGNKIKSTVIVAVASYTAFNIFVNSLPLLNSDGYKILLLCFNINEKRKTESNEKIIIFFKAFNWVVSAVYFIYFISVIAH